MFSEIAANLPAGPAGGPKAASIISSGSVAPPAVVAEAPLLAAVRAPQAPAEAPRLWAILWRTSEVLPRWFWPVVGLGVMGLAYYFFRRKTGGPEGHVLPGPPVLRILDPDRPERNTKAIKGLHADLVPANVAPEPAVSPEPLVVPEGPKKAPENIVPVHGPIPVWDMPEEDPYEDKVAEPSIDELVKRREAATKELETFMASGLKQIGLKGDVLRSE